MTASRCGLVDRVCDGDGGNLGSSFGSTEAQVLVLAQPAEAPQVSYFTFLCLCLCMQVQDNDTSVEGSEVCEQKTL